MRLSLARSLGLALLLALAASPSQAQEFQLLGSFAGCPPAGCGGVADGGHPAGNLIRGPDGLLYGTALGGAPGARGNIFRVNADGTRTIVYNFNDAPPAHGSGPHELVVGSDGAFYGLTGGGGAHDWGVLFRLGASFTVLHDFANPNFLPPGSSEGAGWAQGLAVGADGVLYGTTRYGGMSRGGTVFKLNGSSISFIHSFGALGSSGGSEPVEDLTLASDGNIYGATAFGGAPCLGFGCGTIFRVTGSGAVEIVHRFDDLAHYNGGGAVGGLLQASDGLLYGIWSNTLFRLSLDGLMTPLHHFPGSGIDGLTPNGNLVEGLGGHLYGTTRGGGAGGHGTIFRLAADGTFTTVHAFSGADGDTPGAGLARGGDGHLYATTRAGGSADLGVLYRLKMPAAIDVTANGGQAPLILGAGAGLQIALAYQSAGTADVATLYFAVLAPWGGLYWLTPTGFVTTPAALYTGPLPTFGPVPVMTLPDASLLPPGDYWWIPVVTSAATGTIYDAIRTTVTTTAVAAQRGWP